MAYLSLKGIGKIYCSDGAVSVGIRGVDLDMERGEFVAVTGRSGSGNSTLLNVISGMDSYEEGELYVFYTYNHYNDFIEYLNYYGGWGEIFGNITGGGKISDKYNCNPTPYVPVARRDFVTGEAAPATYVVYYYVPKFALDAA